MHTYLDFEKSLSEIEGKAEELRALGRQDPQMDVENEAKALDARAKSMLQDLYKGLDPWRKCQVARASAPAPCARLHQCAVHRVHAAGGGPELRGGQGGGGGPRPVP